MCKVCEETERECKRCGEVKPIEEFDWITGEHKYRKWTCKECRKIDKRASRKGITIEEELVLTKERKRLEQERIDLEAKGLRRCTCKYKCDRIRPIEEFYVKKGRITNELIECRRRRGRDGYKKNPEPHKEDSRIRRQEIGNGYRKNKTVISFFI